MSELSQDDEIICALGLNPDEDPDDLVWKRIFPHYFVEKTEESVKTYLLVEIDIPERRTRYGSSDSNIWVHPTIVFYVLTHQEDMHMNMAGESGTRMDYLAELIEEKYEGRQDFGVGTLQLKSDTAGSVNTTYRFRQLVFEAVDLDDSLCEG
ncbi:MAG: hypothetical protein LC100_00350 [Chitinophagales bacterium]|nr:hypothetical protein [Chitinophagales bacterium]